MTDAALCVGWSGPPWAFAVSGALAVTGDLALLWGAWKVAGRVRRRRARRMADLRMRPHLVRASRSQLSPKAPRPASMLDPCGAPPHGR